LFAVRFCPVISVTLRALIGYGEQFKVPAKNREKYPRKVCNFSKNCIY
jgi:hypothetical protein